MNPLEIVNKVASPAVVVNSSNHLLGCNEAARDLIGLDSPNDMAGRLFDVLDARDVFGNRLHRSGLPFLEMARRGEAINSFEMTFRNLHGRRMSVSVCPIVILGPDQDEYALIHVLRQLNGTNEEGAQDPSPQHTPHEEVSRSELTRRETEVLRLLCSGKSSKDIAQNLSVSVCTVRSHVQNVLRKLQAHSKAQVIARAFHEHLV